MASFIEAGSKFIALTDIRAVKYTANVGIGLVTATSHGNIGPFGHIVADLAGTDEKEAAETEARSAALELLQLIALRTDPNEGRKVHTLIQYVRPKNGGSAWRSTELSKFDPRG